MPNNMYEYIFFDLDGTLTDPGEGITNSVAHALRRFGIEPPPREELYAFIGPPLKDSFAKYYGMNGDDCTLAVKYYREYYADKGIFENSLYEGIPSLLSDIRDRGKRMVLATSKPDIFAEKILIHFGIDGYFDFVAGAAMDETRTKKDEVIAYAIEKYGLSGKNDRILMVGDRMHDVLGAAKHGIDTVGVTFGYGSEEELLAAGARFIADTPADILKFI